MRWTDSLSPLLRGEGWGEGFLFAIQNMAGANLRLVPLTRIASQSDLSPQAGRGEEGHTAGLANPAIAQAARSVLTSRHATVI